MHALLCCLAVVAADPRPEQLALLKTFRDEFVAVTPGQAGFPARFIMGRAEGGTAAEQPVREVTFQYNFAIAKYEVPQDLWAAVMGENPSRWQGERNSVEMLSFAEAEAFCVKATELMRAAKLITPQQAIRLPSEAEWEYCARAGSKTAFSFGEDANKLDDYAWHAGNAAGNDPPVGAKKPNAWGLYDMHGYLWEWCADTWHKDYTGAPTDGRAWIVADADMKLARVLRGGSWKDKPQRCTTSYRIPGDVKLQDDAVGLRCILE
jgi:formylglycine-generating enzyme required for sulfatase activity